MRLVMLVGFVFHLFLAVGRKPSGSFLAVGRKPSGDATPDGLRRSAKIGGTGRLAPFR